jgi:tetratricopeptide (TPR) repeat protein
MTARSTTAASQAWQRAVAALRAGDPAAAEKICRRALRETPEAPQLLGMLGAALVEQGRPDAAEEFLRRAVALAPGAAAAHEGLGEALLLQNRLQDALASLEIARRLEPGRLSVLVKMGDACKRLGNIERAVELYRDLVTRAPNSIDALALLADAAFRVGLLVEAETILLRAAALAPERAETWSGLGFVQQQQDKLERAAQSYREAVRLEPGRASFHASLGTVLMAAGHHDDAIAAFERALELEDGHAEALAGLAHALSTVGQTERAIATYRRCIERHPDDGGAYWGLASLRTYRFSADEIAAMRRQLAAGQLATESRTNLEFALATALDGLGDYDAAFEHFQQGNESMRRCLRYDTRVLEAIDRELMQVFSRPFLQQHAGTGNDDPAPIFIVGMPRSGSTLLEQILASHSLVEGTHELPELNRMVRSIGRGDGELKYPRALLDAGPARFRELGTEYLERTRPWRTGAARFTDKMSNNFRHVGLISLILPNARIINARRHPLDSCLSSYKMLFSRGQKFSYDLRELGEYYLQYDRLMNHWREVLPGFVLDVDYEELVADIENQVRRVLDFCALPWEPQCLTFHQNRRVVRTASSEQVRQPLNTAGLHRWRDYERHLGPLIDVLAPLLRRMPASAQPQTLLDA